MANFSGRMSVERFELEFFKTFGVFCDVFKDGVPAPNKEKLGNLRPDDFSGVKNAQFTAAGNMHAGTIRSKFRESFGLDLEVYSATAADGSITLAAARINRGQQGKPSGELSASGRMSVERFETEFEKSFWVPVKILVEGSPAPKDASLASLRVDTESSGRLSGELSIKGNMKVENVIKAARNNLGIDIVILNLSPADPKATIASLRSIGTVAEGSADEFEPIEKIDEENEFTVYEAKLIEFFKTPEEPREGVDFEGEFGLSNYFIPNLSITSYDDLIFELGGKFYHERGEFMSALSEAASQLGTINGEVVTGEFLYGLVDSAIFEEIDQEAVYETLKYIDLEYFEGVDDLDREYGDRFGCRVWSLQADEITVKVINGEVEASVDGIDLMEYFHENELEVVKKVCVLDTPGVLGRSVMNFDVWDGALADQGVELEEAAESMGISMEDIESWRLKSEVPREGIDFLRGLQDEIDEVIAYAPDAD